MPRVFLLACIILTSFTIQPPQAKYINIRLEPGGRVFIGRDTILIGDLANEIQQRLWKSYMGTGKMYQAIEMEVDGEVLMGTRGAALDAIRTGQEKALAELCVMKYKQHFENLDASRQRKIKRQFPVLFQELHW